MKYLLTDDRRPLEELIIDIELELDDDGQPEDPSEPEVDEELAEKILDWWDEETLPLPRNYTILEDGGIIVLVETHMTGTPVIGIWYQANSDTTWPLSGFPFSSLSFEAIA